MKNSKITKKVESQAEGSIGTVPIEHRPRLFIVDGNNYIHRAFHALPPLATSDGRPVGALYGLVRMILSIIKKESPDFLAVVFDTPKPTFRHTEFPAYKATRPPPPDNLVFQLKNMRELINEIGIKTFACDGFEADDVIASIAEKYKNEMEIFLVSADKDLSQLVGGGVFIYNEMKNVLISDEGIVEKYGISPDKFCDWLALTGDKSDNVPGAKGIGPKSATKLIKVFGSIEKIYENINNAPPALRDKLLVNRDSVILSKRLAKLVRDVPLDIKMEELKTEINAAGLEAAAKKWEFTSLLSKTAVSSSIPKEENFKNVKFTLNVEDIASKKNIAARFVSSKNLNGIALAMQDAAAFIDLSQQELSFGENKEEPFLKLLADTSARVITDDAKKLYKYVVSAGRVLRCAVSDISLMGYVIDSEVSQNVLSLARKYLNFRSPSAESREESAKITSLFFELKEILEHALEAKNLSFLYGEIERPLAEILAEMEIKGIKIDVGILKKLSVEIAREIEAAKKEIYSLSGEEFNVNSNPELRRILFEKLKLPPGKKMKTGASVDAQVLTELSPGHPVCGKIIRYRTLAKLKSTYVDAFPRLADTDGRLRTNFNSTGTLTGRLSSSNPNLQNIPAKGEYAREIRSAFVPEGGYTLVSGDYSQIDLRVLAHFSGDEMLAEAFRKGEDIHNFTAALVFKMKTDEITAEQRRIAKTVNFGIVYGMSSFGLAEGLEISRKEAQEIIEKYWLIFPRVKEYIEASVSSAQKKGFTETLFGRRRFVSGKSPFERRVAVNTPIQGTSSDIIKKAMVDIFPHLKEYGAHLILQIHDELLFEVLNAHLAEFSRLAAEKMEGAVKLNVPLKVNMKAGSNFANLNDLE